MHRDLKPENFLIEMNRPFKVVIADFGMTKIAIETALLQAFCGSLMYTAPEMFPGLSSEYELSVDIWSLSNIIFEWIYGVPKPSKFPTLRNKNEKVSDKRFSDWLDT